MPDQPAPADDIPSKEALIDKARHFANTVFLVGAGLLMLAANILQPLFARWFGAETGSQTVYLLATVLIVVLASKRADLALHATKKQCAKYGHVTPNGAPQCSRCLQIVNPQND